MNILQKNLDRYLNDDTFLRLLGEHEVCVLSDFILNEEGINSFWQTYYGDTVPRVVICGINPGRHGAGKTGIPFVDFQSLSQLITGIDRQDSERSAEFFFQVVRQYGLEAFFRSFYVTNVASVGFIRDGKNLNYNELPESALKVVEQNFMQEMETIQPTHVISLGEVVQNTVRKLLPANVDCSMRLPHPAWVTTYRGKEIHEWTTRYLTMLGKFRQSQLA